MSVPTPKIPILFRAWDNKKKAMYNVEEISWDDKGVMHGLLTGGDGRYWFEDKEHADDDDITLIQATGIREGCDPDGEMIFFGDLMKAPSGKIFEVFWFAEEMRIALRLNEQVFNFNVALYELVGNVYQHAKMIA